MITEVKRQIIALGGGGFSMEPEVPLLDRYILAQSPAERPRICFIPTASGDADSYIESFYQFFNQQDCIPTHLSLFKGHTNMIYDFVMEQDILYVGGGNTRNMLVLWKEWQLDRFILEAYQKGTVLCGVSAGAICWFDQGLTDSVPNELNALDGLGLLRGSNCPHFDGEPLRRPAYTTLIAKGSIQAGIAADDGVGLHYIDEELHRVISSRPPARAYRFSSDGMTLSEEELTPDYLGE
ncbi:MAG: peptidase E [Bacteroidota bacterium]